MNDFFSYENGLLVNFLFIAYNYVNLLIQKNSIFERNLNKVGLRLSWTSLSAKEYYIDESRFSFIKKIIKFIFMFVLDVAFAMLSWLGIAIRIIMIIYFYNKRFGMPTKLKEYAWKLKNIDMSFHQLILAGMEANNVDESQYDSFSNEVLEGMRERGFKV